MEKEKLLLLEQFKKDKVLVKGNKVGTKKGNKFQVMNHNKEKVVNFITLEEMLDYVVKN